MSETNVQLRADAQGEKLDAILKAVAGLIARVDDMEKNLPAPPLVTAADKKAKKDDDDAMLAPKHQPKGTLNTIFYFII